MDNRTLCNQEIIDLENIHMGRIYSHIDYHVNQDNLLMLIFIYFFDLE
jgi:hypothetical protein